MFGHRALWSYCCRDSAGCRGGPWTSPHGELKQIVDTNKENAGGEWEKSGSCDDDSRASLLLQGYTQDQVCDALRVSQNNVKMAEDILRTFVRQKQ